MTKFEEMRLRAIKFQEITGCGINISANEIILIQGPYTSTFRGSDESPAYLAGFFNEWGVVDEEHWIMGINEASDKSGIEVRFPSLLEPQPRDPKILEDALDAIKNLTTATCSTAEILSCASIARHALKSWNS